MAWFSLVLSATTVHWVGNIYTLASDATVMDAVLEEYKIFQTLDCLVNLKMYPDLLLYACAWRMDPFFLSNVLLPVLVAGCALNRCKWSGHLASISALMVPLL